MARPSCSGSVGRRRGWLPSSGPFGAAASPSRADAEELSLVEVALGGDDQFTAVVRGELDRVWTGADGDGGAPADVLDGVDVAHEQPAPLVLHGVVAEVAKRCGGDDEEAPRPRALLQLALEASPLQDPAFHQRGEALEDISTNDPQRLVPRFAEDVKVQATLPAFVALLVCDGDLVDDPLSHLRGDVDLHGGAHDDVARGEHVDHALHQLRRQISGHGPLKVVNVHPEVQQLRERDPNVVVLEIPLDAGATRACARSGSAHAPHARESADSLARSFGVVVPIRRRRLGAGLPRWQRRGRAAPHGDSVSR
eukprot:scaffold7328_cov314-Pinguiococcus_pyrenoidosus.AAC.37